MSAPAASSPLLAPTVVASGENLVKHYRLKGSGPGWADRPVVHALNGVSVGVHKGRTLGVIGESGSGKSTLGRLLLALEKPTSGVVRFEGQDLAKVSAKDLRRLRRGMGLVFQNPYTSVNRRRRVLSIVKEPLEAHSIGERSQRDELARLALARAGLPSRFETRLASQLSGGQLQRVAIARAIVTEPKLLVADEPTASLDVSVRAQLVNLFADLQADIAMAIVFISHDLGTVSYLADEVVVMYLGRVVESGPVAKVESDPLHPYTTALIAAIPPADPTRRVRAVARGEIPSAVKPPSGCSYHPRCPMATERCRVETPPLVEVAPGRRVACWEVTGEVRAPASKFSAGQP